MRNELDPPPDDIFDRTGGQKRLLHELLSVDFVAQGNLPRVDIKSVNGNGIYFVVTAETAVPDSHDSKRCRYRRDKQGRDYIEFTSAAMRLRVIKVYYGTTRDFARFLDEQHLKN